MWHFVEFPMSRTWLTLPLILLVTLACCYEPCGYQCDPAYADVSQKAMDLAYLTAVDRAEEGAAGSTIGGSAEPLGGMGKGAIGIRAVRTARHAPEVTGVQVRTDGPQSSQFASQEGHAITVHADAALGLAAGFRLGDLRIGAVDLTGSLSRYAAPTPGSLHLAEGDAAGGIGAGWGLRVGLVSETRVTPSVTYTVSRRTVPSLQFASDSLSASDGRTATLSAARIGLSTSSWRLALSKHAGRFALTAGGGRDRHDIESQTEGALISPAGSAAAVNDLNYSVWRNQVYGGVSYSMEALTFVVEAGRSWHHRSTYPVPPLNTLREVTANHSGGYLSVGMRVDLGRGKSTP